MRTVMRWIRRSTMRTVAAVLVAAAVVVVAAFGVANRIANGIAASRPPSGYTAGTVGEPAYLGENFREVTEQGVPWRWGALTRVAELAPADDGYSGRCYVSVGWIETTKAGYAEHSEDERSLTVAFYADGSLIPTGDASASCSAANEFVAASLTDAYHPLANVTEADLPLPQFYAVTYIADDVRPDYVLLTPSTPELLADVPSTASVYRFAAATDPRVDLYDFLNDT